MKYIFLLVFTLSTICTDAQLSYGLKSGLNIARMTFTNEMYSTSSKTGLYAGLLVNYKTAGPIAIQAELLYSQEGTKERFTTGISGEIKETFLQVPLMLRYTFLKGIYVEAGPQLGFLLKSEEKFGTDRDDIKPFYKSTDLRFPFGMGYRFNEIINGFGINARYSFSLSDVNKTTVSGGDLRNSVFSVGIEYTLPLADR
jgi:hypothetical protein